MSTSKLNSFVKEFAAMLTGDSAEVKAQRGWRQADSAFKVQIANLNGDIISKEDAVDVAKENLAKARLNYGNEITDKFSYIQALLSAKESLVKAEKALKAHQDTITFLEEQYEALKA